MKNFFEELFRFLGYVLIMAFFAMIFSNILITVGEKVTRYRDGRQIYCMARYEYCFDKNSKDTDQRIFIKWVD